MTTTQRFETIVIGAGQAGLSVGYHLAKQRREFVVLESNARVGDVWRNRFDSLRLFTPAKYDGLPGWGIPQKSWSWPSKDALADYLETYAVKFDLPIRTGVHVDRLSAVDGGYRADCGDTVYEAANVVVATGGWQTPRTPDVAALLDPSIRQLHSYDYRNPGQLQDGAVLVVGLSHSGGDIALEVSATHETIVAGPVRGEIPFDIESGTARIVLPFMWFAANHVLTQRTPMGRTLRGHIRSEGGPLLRVKRAHLAAAGVTHFEAKVTDVTGGLPTLSDGTVVDVRNIVWCTGFDKDLSWIDIPVAGADGWPEQNRGRVVDSPGLYFVGLPFQFAFASMLVGGVGADAAVVARDIARRTVQSSAMPAPHRAPRTPADHEPKARHLGVSRTI